MLVPCNNDPNKDKELKRIVDEQREIDTGKKVKGDSNNVINPKK